MNESIESKQEIETETEFDEIFCGFKNSCGWSTGEFPYHDQAARVKAEDLADNHVSLHIWVHAHIDELIDFVIDKQCLGANQILNIGIDRLAEFKKLELEGSD